MGVEYDKQIQKDVYVGDDEEEGALELDDAALEGIVGGYEYSLGDFVEVSFD